MTSNNIQLVRPIKIILHLHRVCQFANLIFRWMQDASAEAMFVLRIMCSAVSLWLQPCAPWSPCRASTQRDLLAKIIGRLQSVEEHAHGTCHTVACDERMLTDCESDILSNMRVAKLKNTLLFLLLLKDSFWLSNVKAPATTQRAYNLLRWTLTLPNSTCVSFFYWTPCTLV